MRQELVLSVQWITMCVITLVFSIVYFEAWTTPQFFLITLALIFFVLSTQQYAKYKEQLRFEGE